MGLLPSMKVTSTKKQPMQSGEGANSPVLESSCISFQQVSVCVAKPQVCYPYLKLYLQAAT